LLVQFLEQWPVLLAGHAAAAEGVASSQRSLSLLQVVFDENGSVVHGHQFIGTMRPGGCEDQLLANKMTSGA